MALFFSSLKCQHYYDSGHSRRSSARSRDFGALVSPDTARERDEHALRHLGGLLEERPEVEPLDDEQAQVGLRLDRGRAWLAVEQAHLAEELAGPESHPLLRRDRHERRAVHDDEELLTRLALAAEHRALGDLDDLRDVGDRAQFLGAVVLEERHALEVPDLGVAADAEALEHPTDEPHHAPFVSLSA